MVRLAGFLTGSVVAVIAILLVLGMPERPPAAEPERPPADGTPPPAGPAPIEAAAIPEPEPEPEPGPEPEPEPVAEVPEPPPVEPAAVPVRWHAFWTPFGSRIAANGFVGRLESVTGFDYRVVKVENGVFEVAFAYTTDAERDERLSTIAAATGLELPGT